jgi:hypothetical protein
MSNPSPPESGGLFYNFGQTGQKQDKSFVQWTTCLVQMVQAGAASLVAPFRIRAAITFYPVRKW